MTQNGWQLLLAIKLQLFWYKYTKCGRASTMRISNLVIPTQWNQVSQKIGLLLTITATKTTRPNENDIIVWSPNVHAAHAKKFSKNIPMAKTKRQQEQTKSQLKLIGLAKICEFSVQIAQKSGKIKRNVLVMAKRFSVRFTGSVLADYFYLFWMWQLFWALESPFAHSKYIL